MLTRMRDPTSGVVLVDGQRAQELKLRDLRNVIATLSQEHDLVAGMSVADNTAMGRRSLEEQRNLVERALRLGGAQKCIAKLERGVASHPADTDQGKA
jgi:ATP-binding cassette, subfamily B, bacterial